MRRKKKAFTLTELLVVVVIIGVLSAVVLPKFSKMLNTRRTTEAEDIMSAVRQEQEYRCASDRAYTTAKGDLSSLASLPDNLSSKNYTYTLGGSGITATAKKGSYNLQMPSYEDGRICCSGTGCSDLNKEYIACNNIPVSNSGCEVADPGIAALVSECTDGETRGSQSCSTCGGTQTTQRCVNGVWTNALGACSVAQSSCSCEMVSGSKPSNETATCNVCGTKTISYSCNEDNWTWQRNESACSVSAGQCTCNGTKPSETRQCSSCGGTQTQTVTCDGNTGNWQELGNWSACSKPESECNDCSNATYKANHKAECCPSAAETDEVCYVAVWELDNWFSAQDMYPTPDGRCPGNSAPILNVAPVPEQDCISSCTLSNIGEMCNLEWNDSGCAYSSETYKCILSHNGW